MELVTNRRPAAVATDQCVSLGGRAVAEARDDAVFVLQEIDKSSIEVNAGGVVCQYRTLQSIV
jgi:hypothetical protein